MRVYCQRENKLSSTVTSIANALRVASKFRMKVVFEDIFDNHSDTSTIIAANTGESGKNLELAFH
jgi:hypothetical protein